MARQKAQLEVNNFTRGIITEASPLTFPENASIDEANFIMENGGLRQRRLGMDYEDGYQLYEATPTVPGTGQIAFQAFVWENVEGDPNFRILVLQFGDKLSFFENNEDTTSGNQLLINELGFPSEYSVSGADSNKTMSFAVIDGRLVMVCGLGDIFTFSYDTGTARVGVETSRLRIRDVFGVEDPFTFGLDVVDILDDDYADIRPTGVTITDEHLYNLNNQGWGRRIFPDDTLRTVSPLGTYSGGTDFPSNSQVVWTGVQFNTDNPPKRRFYHTYAQEDNFSVVPAPRGYFTIDALDRGASREAAYQLNIDVLDLPNGGGVYDHPSLTGSSVLPADQTEGGARVVAEFAGRVFYAGFSADVTDGDARSPRMSSYILFSQLVNEPKQITRCHQAGDPTSDTDFDLVATDGGFVKIEGAYNINRLIPIGEALIVMAENGIWAIRGEQGIGFSSTAYEVIKISINGTDAPLTAVEVDNTIIYWGIDGIYQIAPNEVGRLVANNISAQTVQSLYEDISPFQRRTATAAYDSYDRKVFWLINNTLGVEVDEIEVILDVDAGAFYKFEIGSIEPSGAPLPRLLAPYTVPAYNIAALEEGVTVSGSTVTVDGEPVTVTSPVRDSALRELKYVVMTQEPDVSIPQNLEYTFGLYRDNTFVDWRSYDGVGVDAPAYIITGHTTGGDTMKYKQVPTLITHLIKTENGFEVVDGELVPTQQSSCKVQARWDWSNSVNSNRWGREIELYQFKRLWIPEDETDDFDNGYQTVVTRRKLRGKGVALSLKFSTSPGKDCRLLGWAMDMTIQGRR